MIERPTVRDKGKDKDKASDTVEVKDATAADSASSSDRFGFGQIVPALAHENALAHNGL